MTEAWLSGPVEGVDPWLMPAAHALLHARLDVLRATDDLDPALVWRRPGGAASVGYHLQHLAGGIDRLLTYARGEMLSAAQRTALAREADPGDPPATTQALAEHAVATIDRALAVVRATPHAVLLEPREVGRARLPSNVLGLLFHVAEHSARHAGQAITTAKVVRAG
jgi:uncharacterized damage-inducible protein DinB